MLLVHNTPSFCDILTKAVGDWKTGPRFAALRKALDAAKKAGKKVGVHAHHIVPQTVSEVFFPNVAKWVARGQKVLADVGIDFLNGTENLTWALNRDHTVEYAKAVAETLEKAYQRGLAEGGAEHGLEFAKREVEEALKKIAAILNRGEKFRGL